MVRLFLPWFLMTGKVRCRRALPMRVRRGRVLRGGTVRKIAGAGIINSKLGASRGASQSRACVERVRLCFIRDGCSDIGQRIGA
jgi:hypothetical protein